MCMLCRCVLRDQGQFLVHREGANHMTRQMQDYTPLPALRKVAQIHVTPSSPMPLVRTEERWTQHIGSSKRHRSAGDKVESVIFNVPVRSRSEGPVARTTSRGILEPTSSRSSSTDLTARRQVDGAFHMATHKAPPTPKAIAEYNARPMPKEAPATAASPQTQGRFGEARAPDAGSLPKAAPIARPPPEAPPIMRNIQSIISSNNPSALDLPRSLMLE